MEVRKKVSPDYEGNVRGSKIIAFLVLIFPIQVMSKECRNSDCSLFGQSVLFQLNLKGKIVIYKSIKQYSPERQL